MHHTRSAVAPASTIAHSRRGRAWPRSETSSAGITTSATCDATISGYVPGADGSPPRSRSCSREIASSRRRTAAFAAGTARYQIGGRVILDTLMRTLWALVRCSHPGPVVLVTAVCGALALFAGRRWGTVWVVLAVLAGQLFVGWTNDYIDRARDRDAQR